MAVFGLYEQNVGEEFRLLQTTESFPAARDARDEHHAQHPSIGGTREIRIVPFESGEIVPFRFADEDELNEVYDANRKLLPAPF